MARPHTPPTDPSPHWRNRIVRSGEMPADQFLANPANPRRHPNVQREALRGSFDALGLISPVIVSSVTGYMLDGHLRVEECLTRDEHMLIPFIEVDLSEEEEALALVSFDWITQMATYDRAALEDLLQSVDTDSPALQALLNDLAQQNDIDLLLEEPLEDAGPQIDKASELQAIWQTACGQIWIIPSKTGAGSHRLMCGDSANAADVARLMGGAKADACVTDPPYGIGWDTDYTRFTSTNKAFMGTANISRNSDPIVNDDKPFDPTPYLDYPLVILFGANFFAHHLPVGTWLVWDKRYADGSAFLSDAELAWMSKNKGVYIYAETWQGVVRSEKIQHPTQKPTGLFAWCFDKGKAGRLIFDPFLGSGTTMIAAEQTGRVCYGLEIDPSYCAVILQRCADMGLTPVLDTSAHTIEF